MFTKLWHTLAMPKVSKTNFPKWCKVVELLVVGSIEDERGFTIVPSQSLNYATGYVITLQHVLGSIAISSKCWRTSLLTKYMMCGMLMGNGNQIAWSF